MGGAPAPKTESTVNGADWYGRDVSGEEYTRVLFVDVDMTELVNTGAVFTECTFRGVRFNASVHRDAAFLNCTFVGCNLFDTKFVDCKLQGCMFDRCSFDLMVVSGGNWSLVGLPGADLRRATLSDVRMHEADLTGVRCQGGSLRGVDLSGAWMGKADFTDCDLRGSEISALDPETATLRGAIITYEQALVIAAGLGLDVRAE